MNELEQILVGDGFAAPPAHILEGLDEELVHRRSAGASHSIYEEVWHLAFWQQITLDWIEDTQTPYPLTAALGFPSVSNTRAENWAHLRQRFLDGAQMAAHIAHDGDRLARSIRCPSPPGKPVRTMSVREQLENLAAHNAYHLGRIVLLRQLNQAWPPASGGFTW